VRVPTPKQMALLAALPVGHAVVNPRRNQWRPLLNHGWVEPLSEPALVNHGYAYGAGNSYLTPLRITADGLRALAEAVDRHGQPPPVEPVSVTEANWFSEMNSLPEEVA
jgi:hypothetical protein